MKSTNTSIKHRLKNVSLAAAVLLTAFAVPRLQAQTGPFSVSNWPPTIDTNAPVDFLIVDPNAVFTTPTAWNDTIEMQGSGGDETWETITFAGLVGDEATGSFMNPADFNFAIYESMPVIDVLLQVWGNSAFYNGDGSGKNVSFLEGANVTTPHGLDTIQVGAAPPGLDNGQWNWVLFEVTNSIDPDDGNRYVGDPNATSTFGGINGGTLRIQGIGSGLTIRAVAMGPQGAFGTTNQINVFAAGATCNPEPPVNLAFVDINQGVTNFLTIINNSSLGETVSYQSGVGPAGDLRKAVPLYFCRNPLHADRNRRMAEAGFLDSRS
jgi:hypothetical protein